MRDGIVKYCSSNDSHQPMLEELLLMISSMIIESQMPKVQSIS